MAAVKLLWAVKAKDIPIIRKFLIRHSGVFSMQIHDSFSKWVVIEAKVFLPVLGKDNPIWSRAIIIRHEQSVVFIQPGIVPVGCEASLSPMDDFAVGLLPIVLFAAASG